MTCQKFFVALLHWGKSFAFYLSINKVEIFPLELLFTLLANRISHLQLGILMLMLTKQKFKCENPF